MWSRARSVCCDMKEVSQSKDWSLNLSMLSWYFLFGDRLHGDEKHE